MGYKIVYAKTPRKLVRLLPLQSLIAVCFLLFAIIVRLSWPEGTEILREVFVSDGLSRDAQALVAMAENLASGEPMSEAVSVFCQEIFGE